MREKKNKINLSEIKEEIVTSIETLFERRSDRSAWFTLIPIAVIGIAMSLFHIYTASQGIFDAWQQRSITLSFVLLLIPFLYRFKWGSKKFKLLVDSLYFLVALVTVVYMITGYPDIIFRESMPNQNDLIFGTLLVLLILEGTRRAVGNVMSILVACFIVYVLFGQNLSGILSHPGFSYQKAIDTYFNTTFGVFGIILGAMSNYIIIFIIFGAFLAKSQAGHFFIELAYALTGSKTGGPAKVAVLASGLMGSIQGAAVSNVATTGTLTIPLMKRVGYKPHFAGGVEAAASAGGQLMPPVMGAAAFIMASNLQIPYIQLALFALIPAVLHFIAVYFMVHFEAKKNNLEGIPKSELPDIKKVFKEGWFLLLPIITIIFLLIMGYSPQFAGFYSILSIIIVSMFRKSSRMSFKQILGALELGARNSVSIGVICAAAGILIGSVNLTGLGLKFSSLVLSVTGDSVLLSLVLIMAASILLGMGMPTVSAYVILAVLGVPALINLGVDPISAHLFVLYFAIMSNVTPPVAVAAYTAAAIARADPNKTAFAGLKICIGSFLIPYMFVFGPALVMQGTPDKIILAVITALIGIIALTSSIQGWLLQSMNLVERFLGIICALLLLNSGWLTDTIGISLFSLILFVHWKRSNSEILSGNLNFSLNNTISKKGRV